MKRLAQDVMQDEDDDSVDALAPVSSGEDRDAAQAFISAAMSARRKRCPAAVGVSLLLGVAMVLFALGQRASTLRSISSGAGFTRESLINGRRGSFFVLGDWGWDHEVHALGTGACQRAIAARMEEKMRELGDVKFVINVGDSFYPAGVVSKADWQWDLKWRNVYSKELRSIPWYSVYGNHDYYWDPCACQREACAQINSNISNLDFFYMPDLTWFKSHPELDLEVIAMDLNMYVEGWKDAYMAELQEALCFTGKCKMRCWDSFQERAEESLQLFYERMERSSAKNLLVFSHYPTDYFARLPFFLSQLRNATRHHVEYFGGHRHSVSDTTTASTAPNHNWLVGGGGGWGCDSPSQGFVVGEIAMNGVLRTYEVLVDGCCDV
jgi:hypothetical protein